MCAGCQAALQAPDPRSGDLQWRVLHGALATNMFLSKIDKNVGNGCPFCNSPETVVHVFTECNRLSPVLALLKVLRGKMGVLFCGAVRFGTSVFREKQNKKCADELFGQAKLAT